MTALERTTRARNALPHAQRVTGRKRFDHAVVGPDEREHLATGMGALLRATRIAAGLSVRRMAAEAGASPSTLSALERGVVRPRPTMLRDLVLPLDPHGTIGLVDQLAALAGDSLRQDTEAGLRRRRRRRNESLRRRRTLARLHNLHRQAAMRALTGPSRLHWKRGALARNDLASLVRQAAIFDQARRQHAHHEAAAAAIRRRFRYPIDTTLVQAAMDAFLCERTHLARASRVAAHPYDVERSS